MGTEINIVRGILTLVLMLTFITLVVWLYGRRHQHTFDHAARLPLEEDDKAGSPHAENESRQS